MRTVRLTSLFILGLLLAGIALTILSVYFFTRLDEVVLGDLYKHGLRFDYEWIGRYWAYARLILGLLGVTIAVTGIATTCSPIFPRTDKTRQLRLVGCLLLSVGIVTTGLSAFYFTQLDYFVHNDLYGYGLQLSYEWAVPYWAYAGLILTLMSAAIVVNGIAIVPFLGKGLTSRTQSLPGARHLLRFDPIKRVCSVFFIAGIILSAFSYLYASLLPGFVGLSLVFWGAVLLYVRPEKYVKETLLDKTALPSLADLSQMVMELGYKGKGIYLPPKYLRNFESSRIYISEHESTKLPSLEEMHNEEDKIVTRSKEGISMDAPGAELVKLFEDTIGTDFANVDLKFLEQEIPKLLTQTLEIARNITIETEGNIVRVRMDGSIYSGMCSNIGGGSGFHGSLGCPLCSAIACALAKATGKPLIIENEKPDEDGQTIETEYRLLDE